MHIVRLDARRAAARIPLWMDLWFLAFAAPPYGVDPGARPLIEAAFKAHLREPGFRLVAAYEGETPLGFAYGFMRRPGQDWVEEVERALGDRAALLQGAFGFVEIAVRPDAQGRGVGGALHDALLSGLQAPRAVLTVHEAAPALGFYRRRGWEAVGRLLDAPYIVLLKALEDEA